MLAKSINNYNQLEKVVLTRKVKILIKQDSEKKTESSPEETFDPSIISAPNPRFFSSVLCLIIFSRPSNAPPAMNSILVVSSFKCSYF